VNTYLERTQQAIEHAVAGLTTEQLARAPQGKWSAEAVLEHLDLTFSGSIQNLRKTLELGPRPLSRSLLQRVAAWVIVDLGYFPTGFKAPEFAVPKGGRGAEVVASIKRHLEEMDAVLDECDAKLGRRVTFKHPRLGALNSAQWRRFHLVHTRHHMKQVARLRARL